MTIDEAKVWILKQPWVFAKSYSQTFPHVYTTRDRCKDIFEFEEFLTLIREKGIVKTFFSKQYIYLEIDGEEFWEMGRPIKAVQVLNRAKINDNASYRFPLPSDGDAKTLKAKLNLRECVMNSLLSKEELTIKECEILNFLLNNDRRTPAEREIEIKKYGSVKNVIDHSNIKIRYE
jgi:hypothetical protein